MINCFEIKSTASMKKYLKNIEREYRIMRRELAYIKGKLEIVEKNIYNYTLEVLFMNQRKMRKLLLNSLPIATERLIIRNIESKDALDMYEYSSIPEVSEYLLWSPHLNISTTEGYINSLQERYKKGLYGDWALELKDSGKMIGTCGYAALDTLNKSCEIGYVLSPKFQSQGYMTEAMKQMLALTFDVMHLEKAILRIIKENDRSINLAEKLGFRYGHSINMDIKGAIREVTHYFLTYEEYEVLKKKKQSI